MVNKLFQLLLFVTLLQVTESTFSKGFQNFLKFNYGQATAANLTRLDMGTDGSFGGGSSSVFMNLVRDPFVVIHGLNTAAGGMVNISIFFEKYGYAQGSVFATTYGPNGTVINGGDTIICTYLKQIRTLILAVNRYTRRRVAVAGYSLGSAVTRKAILGGICLDNNQTLGSPLTNIVSSYMGVAGANHGAILCEELPTAPMCNNITGFTAGSQFLIDINKKQGYEGQSRYVIDSLTDEVVGFQYQGIAAANANVTLDGFLHVDECYNTLHIQYSLVTNGYTTQRIINIDAAAQTALSGTNCSGTVKQAPTRWNYYNPVDLEKWYKKSSGNQSHGDGSYNETDNCYTFKTGYSYQKNAKLTSSQFESNKQLF